MLNPRLGWHWAATMRVWPRGVGVISQCVGNRASSQRVSRLFDRIAADPAAQAGGVVAVPEVGQPGFGVEVLGAEADRVAGGIVSELGRDIALGVVFIVGDQSI